ncbi:MAG: hypothetical protein GEV11_09685 [Streptosporangiales bacterium]|nr:hypothetical protein [Streptosporangiales bacterium]
MDAGIGHRRGDHRSPLGPTVRDLPAEPRFRLRLLAGAAGLDRPVRWAHSTELLDPGPYLRGHEAVLTVGASLTSPSKCVAFARACRANRASAVLYEIGNVTPHVPAPLVEACEELGLPLFEVPKDVPFVGVTEWLAEQLAAERESDRDRRELGRLLELVADGLASPEALRGGPSGADLPDRPATLAVPAGHLDDLPVPPEGWLAGAADEVAYVLVADPAPLLARCAERGIPCGTAPAAGLDGLPRALNEARLALDLARRSGGVVEAARLATFRGLLAQLDPDRLTPFAERMIRPLAAYDAGHGSGLLETLRVYIGHGGSVATASRALYLHTNSLRHRLARIETLTGANPLDFEDRIPFAIALTAWPDPPR